MPLGNDKLTCKTAHRCLKVSDLKVEPLSLAFHNPVSTDKGPCSADVRALSMSLLKSMSGTGMCLSLISSDSHLLKTMISSSASLASPQSKTCRRAGSICRGQT